MQTWEICLTTGMVKSTRGSLVGVDIEGCSMTTSRWTYWSTELLQWITY